MDTFTTGDQSLLLSVPAEIRLRIWTYLLERTEIHIWHYERNDSIPKAHFPVALTSVSKQVRLEVLPMIEKTLCLEIDTKRVREDLKAVHQSWLDRVRLPSVRE